MPSSRRSADKRTGWSAHVRRLFSEVVRESVICRLTETVLCREAKRLLGTSACLIAPRPRSGCGLRSEERFLHDARVHQTTEDCLVGAARAQVLRV